jgi:hypothetical protein
LWTAPESIADRDLFFGQGGPERAPMAAPYVFEKEDGDGTSPKFVVRDANGLKWKVKPGAEAKPETVVTRFIWAMGYAVDEDYFLPAERVENMPAKLKRGQEYVSADGVIRDARWERMDREKVGNWRWSKNPFSGTRELNGLRVLMALFNSWDVKSVQNAVYEVDGEHRYVVSDLGATLGPTGTNWPVGTTKGDLERYRRSDFIKKADGKFVDFATPSWPMLFGVIPVIPLPYGMLSERFAFIGFPPANSPTSARSVTRNVPQEHVAWIASLLTQLTPDQIRQAFRSANYTPEEVEGFSSVIEARIQALASLEP